MDDYNFALNFIQAYQSGLAAKRAKRIEAEETEDRDVEKEILQHRIKEIKLGERLKERDLAKQNLDFLSGMPEKDYPDNAFEPPNEQDLMGDPGGVASAPGGFQGMGGQPLGGAIEPMERRLNPVQIPGVEGDLLGGNSIPGVSARPQTLEQMIAIQLQQARMKTLNTPQRLSRGQQLVMPATGEVMAEGQPFVSSQSTRPVPVRERDKTGKTTTTYLPPDQVAGKSFVQEPMPVRPSAAGGGGQSVTADTMSDFVAGITSGTIPPDSVPKSALGVKIMAEVKKQGYDLNKAQLDQRAMRQHLSTMNSEGVTEMLMTADAADEVMTDLEALAEKWDGGGLLGSLTVALARSKGDETAFALEDKILEAKSLVAKIRSGGSQTNNKVLESIDAQLQPNMTKTRLKAVLKTMRDSLKYRVNAVRSASTQLSGEPAPVGNAGAAGAAPTAESVAAALKAQGRPSDPATVKKVMASPEAMKALLGK